MQPSDVEDEQAKRDAEMKALRQQQADKQAHLKKKRWIRQLIIDSKHNTNRVLNSMKRSPRTFNSLKTCRHGWFRR